jgi:hypothetical protein
MLSACYVGIAGISIFEFLMKILKCQKSTKLATRQISKGKM